MIAAGVRRIHRSLRLLAGAGLFFGYAGCSFPPDSVSWNPEQAVLRPESSASTAPRNSGRLVVETAETGNPENGKIPHAAYYVYDLRGRFVDRFPSDFLTPVGLPVGRYVVVSHCAGAFRKVQVEIVADQTTLVSLKDFKTAPAAE